MSAVIAPEDLVRRFSRTAAGRSWLDSLPDRIEQCLRRWGLRLDEDSAGPWSGFGSMVVAVARGTEPLVLKLAYPYPEASSEPVALRLWDGDGAVRLVDDDGDGALLLERLDGGRRLQDVPFPEATAVWGDVVRRLSIPEDDRPAWAALDRIDARAERWSDELPERWTRLDRPFPRWLLEAALDVCATRGVVGRRGGVDVLVHTDLHGMNVLGTFDAASDEGFRAIDPQAAVGEAEFAVAPMLWNRLPELRRGDPSEALLERCHDLASAAGIDPEGAREWAVLREVENALWYAAKPDHEGDLERSLWVASALCSRPLPGLPDVWELKRLG
ncbi:aminoglycoside phosphotransferase family protein [Sinomonas sp. ASV322]|uniref:aminoglycoside phosphotransferase family protein n=1 Tax=Sinomonas sp. ASV322 TaxID=3041920 RepID=UPI0027DE05F9|nr:aminoglycoside phosphotransferase family protein [Sinomonas sp. ASV322]MDQ4502722.1 aminoglycoside phosphotransferase family protein [Sinomonas sp. ASV322]